MSGSLPTETQASTVALVAAERTQNEGEDSRMRRAAVERLDQMERENEIDWPLLKDLSEGRDDIAAQAIQREVADACDWWRAQLQQRGHEPEAVERLVRAYADAFWIELRDRVCGFSPGGGSKISA
ncbi:MAG: hypothetical protein M3O00_15560 [Pseudomonadota bacterium]|nr:hypothetical protein [Pseudomonadota bacterium]